MPVQVRPEGPIPARIMIVGEAPGFEEELAGTPFVGQSGKELNKMLHEVGILRSECFVTNVCRVRPPGNDISAFMPSTKKEVTKEHVKLRDRFVSPVIKEGFDLLWQEIQQVKPNVIVALGNVPLWALTGKWGITKWRGSFLRVDSAGSIAPKVIPTIHPAAVLRQWEQRSWVIRDLQRAATHMISPEFVEPLWNFRIRPTLPIVMECLNTLLARLDSGESFPFEFDLETRRGHIACIGVSWSLLDAICIPFMVAGSQAGSYWSEEEEGLIVHSLYKLLTHKNAQVRGQNLLYDSQYTFRHWHFIPRVTQDTMISHHVTFAALPKRLDFQSSLYCQHHVYWKDDGKEWDIRMGEDQYWVYNATDCVRTRECAEVEKDNIKKFKLESVEEFQQKMFYPVLQTMIRGVRIDQEGRKAMQGELEGELASRDTYFKEVLGHTLNPRSTQQMQNLFYKDLVLPVQINRATGKPTLNDDALTKLAAKEPLIKPLIKNIQEYRSLGVFLSTFVNAPLDQDGRMRCSYNLCGTVVFRLSSSENAFGSGTNLQNIPKGTKAREAEDLELPNIRKIFIPDEGFTFFDMDLDRADLQVVAWEAEDKELKLALKLGLDMHCFNAMSIYGIKHIPPEELVETHPNYKDHRGRITEDRRQKAKVGAHAVDYYCKERTLATALGCSLREAEHFIKSWLGAHPGIKEWQDRTFDQLQRHRFVENKYGYRCYFFDRPDNLLPEALAWVPASTVAVTINKAWYNIYQNLPEAWVLLQVHDSLAGQFPTHLKDRVLARLKEESRIVIPYEDPLIIPIGIKTSETSWGDCK